MFILLLVFSQKQNNKSLMHLAEISFDINLCRNYEIHHAITQGWLEAFCCMSVLLINIQSGPSKLTSGMLGLPCTVSCTDILPDPL